MGLFGFDPTGTAWTTTDGVPAPTELLARTWNRYGELLLSVVTVWVSVLLLPLPGVTVCHGPHAPNPHCRYCQLVMVPEGAFQLRATCSSSPVAVKSVGWPGAANGVAETESDSAPFPAEFTARILKE